ncbi:MAG TPA: hypothetical protein VJ761_23155 [Ktedonobacteraceae bacterium]|nr:hypothetical protein [Ktedonobacteraceae bacterium]
MSIMSLLIAVFLLVFLVLAILLIMAVRTPNAEYDPDYHALPQSKHAQSFWLNKIGKVLVRRPWPYKDLYNPLNRLYWPDEHASNRIQRRRVRGKNKR